jgi:hypothetical protein
METVMVQTPEFERTQTTDPREAKLKDIIEKGKSSLQKTLEEIQHEFAIREDMAVRPTAIDFLVQDHKIQPVTGDARIVLTVKPASKNNDIIRKGANVAMSIIFELFKTSGKKVCPPNYVRKSNCPLIVRTTSEDLLTANVFGILKNLDPEGHPFATFSFILKVMGFSSGSTTDAGLWVTI